MIFNEFYNKSHYLSALQFLYISFQSYRDNPKVNAIILIKGKLNGK